jgi:hypothetical protein
MVTADERALCCDFGSHLSLLDADSIPAGAKAGCTVPNKPLLVPPEIAPSMPMLIGDTACRMLGKMERRALSEGSYEQTLIFESVSLTYKLGF